MGVGSRKGTNKVRIENSRIVNPGFGSDGPPGIDCFIAAIDLFATSRQVLMRTLIQRNTIIDADYGLQDYFERGASIASLDLDAGLGGLGSQGENRIIGSQVADIYVGARSQPFHVDAANNWSGSDAGPASVIELGGATVNVTPFLTEDPEDD